MVRLTEEMVVARTRVSDFSSVKKLNCWGTELTDVSILRKMKNVEVLSLSVNNIDSLADFQFCINLQDLFVRKNNIKDLNEVCYLQGLPNLRNLWLGENPCADIEGYRLAVIRALPNLEKLDDKMVSPEEVQTAMARGRVLGHPLDIETSLQQSEPTSPEEIINDYLEEGEPEPESNQQRRYSSSDDQRSFEEVQHGHDEYHDTDKRNANYNTSPSHQYPQNNQYSYELRNGQVKSPKKESKEPKEALRIELFNNGGNQAANAIENLKDYDDRPASSRHNGEYEDRRGYSEYTGNEMNQRSYASVSPRTQYPSSEYVEDRRIERNNYDFDDRRQLDYDESQYRRVSGHQNIDRDEQMSHLPGWVRHTEKEKCKSQFHYHRRPVTRNSNILSAVLCLVKELDYPSLEVVEMAVRNRMDELEE